MMGPSHLILDTKGTSAAGKVGPFCPPKNKLWRVPVRPKAKMLNINPVTI